MTASAARLQRLHRLRCRMAEAASADGKRIAQEVRCAEQATVALEAQTAALLRPAGGSEQAWSEMQACLQVAAGYREQLVMRRAGLLEAEEAARLREREAVQAREQMGRMLEKVQAEAVAEQSRREQARMDDLFATTRVRAAMAMTF